MIQLVRDDENLTHKVGEATILYRRIPAPKRNQVIKKHTKKGQVNWSEVAAELLEYAVTGWEGVMDGKTPVKFDSALLSRLPEEVRGDLMELTGAAAAENVAETSRGNSKGGSSGT